MFFGTCRSDPMRQHWSTSYLNSHDFAASTRRAVINDLRKFAMWFSQANAEPFRVSRVTTRDITDFKNCLRRERNQAVAIGQSCLGHAATFLRLVGRERASHCQPSQAREGVEEAATCTKGSGPRRGKAAIAGS